MKPDLAELVTHVHTAIVTQECQGVIVGPDAGLLPMAIQPRTNCLPSRRGRLEYIA